MTKAVFPKSAFATQNNSAGESIIKTTLCTLSTHIPRSSPEKYLFLFALFKEKVYTCAYFLTVTQENLGIPRAAIQDQNLRAIAAANNYWKSF